MAKLSFDNSIDTSNNPKETVSSVVNEESINVNNPTGVSGSSTDSFSESIQQASYEDQTSPSQSYSVNQSGMSAEELRDPNKIVVTIADYNTPLVIFFGPPACGKTMTLIRLTRYLQSRGYTIQPVESFRPAYDRNYQDMCDNFNAMISSDDAAKSTSRINFMLIQVLQNGRPLCQILEGPGEYYFKPEEPQAQFPRYINAIMNSQNRKIWAIMVEPDTTNKRMDVSARRQYVNKIHKLKTRINPRDKVMFVFNKIDETPFVINASNIRYGLAMQHTEYLYPGIFAPFKNVNPITKIWRAYDCDFVAFHTGDFSAADDGTLGFEQGPDTYPKNLWEKILSGIKG